MKLYVGHITRNKAFIMPCMFLVCAEDIHQVFDNLCDQYVSYFKGIPSDTDIFDLGVEFNIVMLPNEVAIMDEPVSFDFIEIMTAIADDGKELVDECADAEGV